ncbi:MAG: RHS repeat-associated core domain-containing protein [Limisphaerales bacterium]
MATGTKTKVGRAWRGFEWVGALVLAWMTHLGLPREATAQQPRIEDYAIGANGRLVLRHDSDPDSYYILRKGEQVHAILTARDVQAGVSGVGQLSDSTPLGGAAFYRVQRVPVSAPLDTDGDGLDDICELKHRPLLDPLVVNDASQDPDGDGKTTLRECAEGTHPFVPDRPPVPETPTLTYPTNATTSSFVVFSGRGPTNTLIRVEGGAAYVTNRVDGGGGFELTVPLTANRLNRLFVSAVDEAGLSSPLAPIDILQDSTPPYLFIDTPASNSVLTTETTVVAGRVGDALSGFLGLSVMVNGEAARVDVGIGPNGTFERGPVPLNVGVNTIVVVAADRLGNSMTRRLTVTRQVPSGPRLLAISGDLQETDIRERLPAPLVVRATQANGAPMAGRAIEFRVTRSDGRLLAVNPEQLAEDILTRSDYSTNGTMSVALRTDANGEARVWWTTGTDAGHANNRVTASAEGIDERVYFCSSARARPASQINIGSGNHQRGETFAPAPEPLKVWVSDGNNPAAGIPVTFSVVQGGGSLVPIAGPDGASPAGPGLRASRPVGSVALHSVGQHAAGGSPEVTVLTSVTGHAEVDFTLGPQGGNQIVEATFPGNPGMPATFVLHGLQRVVGQPTSFVGLVQDNAFQPLGGATIDLEVAGAMYRTVSDVDGRFGLQNVASGAGHLHVNGLTVTTVGDDPIPTNSFPSLQYTLVVVPNAENSLPLPVLLPRLNPNNARWYAGTNDIVLTCEGMEGLRMTIAANSMKHPDGEIVSPSRPALLSLNQVHHDDIPMPMPDGASPPFAWTLQPGGATFDPPVQVEYPNMSGLAPGAAAFFLTFNHDTERFEIVASGHVVEDGSRIVCDPGAGLTISGWGCNCPPYSVITECLKDLWRDFVEYFFPKEKDPDAPPPEEPDQPPSSNTPNNSPGSQAAPLDDNEHTAGDPVIAATGELIVEETDLEIPGRGFPFKFTRVYRSQYNYNGPMGFNWDFNHNRRLFVPSPEAGTRDVVLLNGFARTDTYAFDGADGRFVSPRGYFDQLFANSDGTFTLRDADGFKTHFDVTGLMTRQEDRLGNTMTFLRDASGRLTTVVDTLGRSIEFTYNAQGRLKRLRDFMGREVFFGYDAEGDLRAVSSPAVTGTSNGNDFPDGKIVQYEYSAGFNPASDPRLAFLNHNLISVTDPKRQRYLVNRYGENPNAYDFDRVISQQSGGPEQVYTFSYQQLSPGVTPPSADLPVNQTTVVDRNGNRTETIHNALGNALETRIYTDRNVNPEDPDVFVTRHTYNADGRRLSTTFPEGNQVLYTFDDANPDRYQQGNLVRVTQLPGPRGGDQTSRVITRRYEPIFNQLLSETDARGNDPAYVPPNGGDHSPARYTTRFTFDYQEGNSLGALAAEMRRAPAEVQALLASAGIALNQGDLNGDALADQARGQIVRREDPTVRLLADSAEAAREGGVSQPIVTTFAYNRFGQLISRSDPEGNVDDYLYHPERDPDGDGTSTVTTSALAADTGGYLFAVVEDSRSGPRRRSTSPPVRIRTERFYDPVGNLIRSVDGRGNDTLFEVNSLNQVVQRQSRLVETSAGPRRYRHFFTYDANNKLIQEDVENVDATGPGLDGFVTTTYAYDHLDNLVEKNEEAAAGQILITRYAYDSNDNLVRITQPEGNSVEITYDERDLRFAVTRGAGTPLASTRTFTYDGNGKLRQTRDAADNNGDGQGEEIVLNYDGFDRLVRAVDAVGNELRLGYDPANRRVRAQRFGVNGGPSPADASGEGNVLLSGAEARFDELGRDYQRDTHLFSNVAPVGPEGPLTAGDGKVSTRFEYDRNGRLSRVLDDNQHALRLEYDGADRLIRQIDALNNERLFTYDANHNRVATTEIERSPEGIVPEERFVTRREFDALDRVVREIDNLTNVVSLAYDSRNNVFRKTDALGNTTTYLQDGLNRPLAEIVTLRVGGTGSGAVDPSNPTNPDGRITTLSSWDGNSRLISLIDDNGNATRYTYDALNRRVLETFADNTTKAYEYDGDDNVVRFTDNAGNVHQNRYDGVHRLVAKDVTRAPGVEGTTQWKFEYDGLSRRTLSFDNNDPANAGDDALCRFQFDSLNRLVKEIQGSHEILSTFDGVGNRVSLRYPGDRVLQTTYDALNRVESIRDEGAATFVAEYDYLGPWRVLERRHGNGTRMTFHDGAGRDIGYDGLRRRVRIEHRRADDSLIAGFAHAFDKADNRRYERDLFRGTVDVFEYDSSYRVTRAALELPEASVAAIRNNDTVNADVTALTSARQADYQLDGVGNWTRRTQDGVPTVYAVNEMNEYTSVGGVPEVHDDNGNLVNDGSRRFHYDFANRLVRITDSADAEIARYVYDAGGRRVMKTTGGVTTEFLLDRVHEIEERENGAVARQYVFGPRVDEVLELTSGGDRYFYHQNHIDSVTALTDGSSAVVERYSYREYGKTIVLDSEGDSVRGMSEAVNFLRYTGRRLDGESGLYFYRARYHSSDLGRFLQRDPRGYVDGMGLYCYVRSNPVSWTDPTGFQTKKTGGGVPIPPKLPRDGFGERQTNLSEQHPSFGGPCDDDCEDQKKRNQIEELDAQFEDLSELEIAAEEIRRRAEKEREAHKKDFEKARNDLTEKNAKDLGNAAKTLQCLTKPDPRACYKALRDLVLKSVINLHEKLNVLEEGIRAFENFIDSNDDVQNNSRRKREIERQLEELKRERDRIKKELNEEPSAQETSGSPSV